MQVQSMYLNVHFCVDLYIVNYRIAVGVQVVLFQPHGSAVFTSPFWCSHQSREQDQQGLLQRHCQDWEGTNTSCDQVSNFMLLSLNFELFSCACIELVILLKVKTFMVIGHCMS